MKKFIEQVTNSSNLPVNGATVTVRVANASPGTGALATIYSDDGITPTTNPVTTDATGIFSFYVADGRYDLVVSCLGVTRTYSDFAIFDVLELNAADAVENITANVLNSSSGALNGTIGLTTPQAGVFTTASIKTLEGIRFADQFAGADWAAKVNAADADLGTTPGTIYVSSALAGAASTSILFSAARNIKFDAGTFASSVPIAISRSNVTLEGVKGATILQFTGATDGITLPDISNPSGQNIIVQGFNLQTTNASAGKAINASAPTFALVQNTLRNVDISFSGSGRWAYGLFTDNFQGNRIETVYIYQSATIGLHMQNSSMSNDITNLQIVGSSGAGTIMRGIETTGQCDSHFSGGIVQGWFTQSAVNITNPSSGGPFFHEYHFENTNTSPSDGADVVITGTSIDCSFVQCGAASFNVGIAAGSVRNFSISHCETGAITIGSNCLGTSLVALRAASITDNGVSSTILGCTDATGNKLANKVTSHFVKGNATTIQQGKQDSAAAFIVDNSAWLGAVDSTGAVQEFMLPYSAADQMFLQYKTGSILFIRNNTPANKVQIADAAVTLLNGVVGQVYRLKANQGTALVAGDFALSAGFGTTATVTGVIGTDQAWTITVTSSGTGQTANPTITLTFHDGTWTNSPITVTKMNGGTGVITNLTEAPTATTNVITFQGTPVAGSTYIISSVAIGR